MPQSRRERKHEIGDQRLIVATLCKICFEQAEDGSTEWLLDYNLPNLYRSIRDLYVLLGEEDRLKESDATI